MINSTNMNSYNIQIHTWSKILVVNVVDYTDTNQKLSKMDITNVIKGGVSIALKNFFSLLAASILYFLTIWIPY